jgi:septal ring factor EnvC (AmiA/AmiB activator)
LNGGDRKTLRRERALKRQESGKVRKPLEQAISKAERRIAALEKEQDELAGQLMRPQADTDFAKVNRRLHEIQIELEECVATWETSSRQLESMPDA